MSRHTWAEWVESSAVRNFLWRSGKHLKLAWGYDQKKPKDYPINTRLALAEIQDALKSRSKTNMARPLRRPTFKTPRRLAELVSEGIVKAVWEDNHSSRFENAIMQAAPRSFEGVGKSWKVFQQIIRAMEAAYLAKYLGVEFLAKPKANILHKILEEIANAAGLKDLTQKGFAEFLDDLCPCGLRNHGEAVRKLSSRSPQMRRPKK